MYIYIYIYAHSLPREVIYSSSVKTIICPLGGSDQAAVFQPHGQRQRTQRAHAGGRTSCPYWLIFWLIYFVLEYLLADIFCTGISTGCYILYYNIYLLTDLFCTGISTD